MGQALVKQLGGDEIFAKSTPTLEEKTGGDPITDPVERQSLTVIDQIMDMLLKSHMDDLLQKKFCRKVKVFIRDEVMMKQAPDTIKKIGDLVILGQEASTAEDHPKLCEQLTDHYLKKLNLVASAHQTITESYKRLDRLREGGQCYKKDPFALSDVDYQPALDQDLLLQNTPLKVPYKFSQRHSLEVDTAEIRKLALEKALSDNRGKVFLKEGATSKLPSEVKQKLLVREISKPETCKTEGGKWLQNSTQLVRHNLKPSEKVVKYNKAWEVVMKNGENQISKDSIQLMDIVKSLVSEEVVTGKDNKKSKVFKDKPITQEELQEAITQAKKLIYNILSEVDKTYLVLAGVPVVSEVQVNYQNRMEQKKKRLEEKMRQVEQKLSSSN